MIEGLSLRNILVRLPSVAGYKFLSIYSLHARLKLILSFDKRSLRYAGDFFSGVKDLAILDVGDRSSGVTECSSFSF